MEFKWLCIATCIMIVAMATSAGYSEGKRFDCIKEVSRTLKLEDAKSVCKK